MERGTDNSYTFEMFQESWDAFSEVPGQFECESVRFARIGSDPDPDLPVTPFIVRKPTIQGNEPSEAFVLLKTLMERHNDLVDRLFGKGGSSSDEIDAGNSDEIDAGNKAATARELHKLVQTMVGRDSRRSSAGDVISNRPSNHVNANGNNNERSEVSAAQVADLAPAAQLFGASRSVLAALESSSTTGHIVDFFGSPHQMKGVQDGIRECSLDIDHLKATVKRMETRLPPLDHIEQGQVITSSKDSESARCRAEILDQLVILEQSVRCQLAFSMKVIKLSLEKCPEFRFRPEDL